jgi:hypothetical protein
MGFKNEVEIDGSGTLIFDGRVCIWGFCGVSAEILLSHGETKKTWGDYQIHASDISAYRDRKSGNT